MMEGTACDGENCTFIISSEDQCADRDIGLVCTCTCNSNIGLVWCSVSAPQQPDTSCACHVTLFRHVLTKHLLSLCCQFTIPP